MVLFEDTEELEVLLSLQNILSFRPVLFTGKLAVEAVLFLQGSAFRQRFF
jgi:hypothetical protein